MGSHETKMLLQISTGIEPGPEWAFCRTHLVKSRTPRNPYVIAITLVPQCVKSQPGLVEMSVMAQMEPSCGTGT
jgi:hypothetical protein